MAETRDIKSMKQIKNKKDKKHIFYLKISYTFWKYQFFKLLFTFISTLLFVIFEMKKSENFILKNIIYKCCVKTSKSLFIVFFLFSLKILIK